MAKFVSSGIRLVVICFSVSCCCVTGPVTASQSDFLEHELKLEEAVYEFEVRGDVNKSLDLLEEIEGVSAAHPDLQFRFWLLKMRLFWNTGDNSQAKECYRRLKEVALSAGAGSDWLEKAEFWIPDLLIEREVPWENGQRLGFRVESSEAGSKLLVGYHLLSTASETDPEGVEEWVLKGTFVSDEIWRYEVVLDKGSLQVRSTQLENALLPDQQKLSLKLNPFLDAKDSVAETKTAFQGDSLSLSCLLSGLSLQQYVFELGFERSLNFYDIESGESKAGSVSVLSMELVEYGEDLRVPCWVADLNWENGQPKTVYSFENDASRRLVRFQRGRFTATLMSESELETLSSVLNSDEDAKGP